MLESHSNDEVAMVRNVLTALVALTLASCGGGSGGGGDGWGAIAFDWRNSKAVVKNAYPTQAEAEAAAIQACGPSCALALTIPPKTCGALYFTGTYTFFQTLTSTSRTALGATQLEASQRAQSACESADFKYKCSGVSGCN